MNLYRETCQGKPDSLNMCKHGQLLIAYKIVLTDEPEQIYNELCCFVVI